MARIIEYKENEANEIKTLLPSDIELINEAIELLSSAKPITVPITKELLLKLKSDDMTYIDNLWFRYFTDKLDWSGLDSKDSDSVLYESILNGCKKHFIPIFNTRKILRRIWYKHFDYIEVVDEVAKPIKDYKKVIDDDYTVKTCNST